MELQLIQSRIYEIRNQKVMLDFDLAELYGVLTKRLNEQVKRNLDRFPPDFMFIITHEEWEMNRSQIATCSGNNVLSIKHRKKGYLPYAFTEHGVTMLASVLNSETAIQMSIEVVRAFIVLKKMLYDNTGFLIQLKQFEAELSKRIGEHDIQLANIYEALENLLDKKADQVDWENRARIGFNRNNNKSTE